MADICDKSDIYIENVIDDGIAEAMRFTSNIPEGEAGECDYCSQHFSRLVDGACGKCRDYYRLK